MHIVLEGDCIETMRGMGDASIDAIVTDPPYELGFMGKRWDATRIAFNVDVWREALRVLKPGGHMLAFSGTRTYHRMVCAIEDAGFEIRDQLAWMYGTGFPKSKNLGDGRGTALKPAQEPIVLARKPLVGTVAANVLAHGTGALNIDACRIGTDDTRSATGNRGLPGWGMGQGVVAGSACGRWPANVILDEVAGEPLGESSRFFYCAKASKAERESGLEDAGIAIKSAGELTDRKDGSDGLNSPRAGAGRGGGRRNNHPTVKPIALMAYLARLITPPGGTVLDPFAGSGSTGVACKREGFRFVGIDNDASYCELARARIANGQTIEE